MSPSGSTFLFPRPVRLFPVPEGPTLRGGAAAPGRRAHRLPCEKPGLLMLSSSPWNTENGIKGFAFHDHNSELMYI